MPWRPDVSNTFSSITRVTHAKQCTSPACTWDVQQLLSEVNITYLSSGICGISKPNVVDAYMLNFRTVDGILNYF